MDKKNKQLFIDTFQEVVGPALDPKDKLDLENVAEGHLDTLSSLRSEYFALEDLPKISSEAASRLAQVYLKQNPKNLIQAWVELSINFHSENYWGFKTVREKPKVQKKKNEVAGFLWTVFQAAVIMKLVVLYFGINAAELDSDWHYWGLGIAIFISFSSLLFFAYRKSKTYKD